MLSYEYKLDGTRQQYAAIDEAIRVVQFIRNKCLRLWMDEPGISKNDLQCYCAILAREYSFASRLNSQARQASADRAWFAIQRFYDNCKQKKPEKKAIPRFSTTTDPSSTSRRSCAIHRAPRGYVSPSPGRDESRSYAHSSSLAYLQTFHTPGWKLETDGKHISFTDGCGIGRLRLVGNPKQHIETFPTRQIKRVRIVRRADGYYVQFSVQADRVVEHVATSKQVGIDVGLKAFYTDSEGNTVENPRHYRKAEKKLKELHRHVSRKKKGSQNRKKARNRLAKAYLKVQRQREDFARKQANALVTSQNSYPLFTQ